MSDTAREVCAACFSYGRVPAKANESGEHCIACDGRGEIERPAPARRSYHCSRCHEVAAGYVDASGERAPRGWWRSLFSHDVWTCRECCDALAEAMYEDRSTM
jgi:hypothetical protein